MPGYGTYDELTEVSKTSLCPNVSLLRIDDTNPVIMILLLTEL